MSDETEKKAGEQEMLVEMLKEAITAADEKQVAEIVEGMSSQETLRQVSLMKPDERDRFMAMLAPETLAGLVEEAPAELAVILIERLDTSAAAQVIGELDTDIQADIVQDLAEAKAETILEAMSPEHAGDVRTLTQYEPNTAGGLMELDAFSFFTDQTVGDIFKRLVAGDDEFERHRGQHPYIIDEAGRLVGVVSLRNLLRSKRTVLLTDVMTSPVSVTVNTHQDELARLFDDNPFLGIPVVDDNNVLVGVVSREAVTEAELERVEQQSRSRQKIGDELRSMPTLLRSRRRLAWLSSNIVLNIIAASVIAAYEETLAAVIAIAVFLPMVSDMSGCSGNRRLPSACVSWRSD